MCNINEFVRQHRLGLFLAVDKDNIQYNFHYDQLKQLNKQRIEKLKKLWSRIS